MLFDLIPWNKDNMAALCRSSEVNFKRLRFTFFHLLASNIVHETPLQLLSIISKEKAKHVHNGTTTKCPRVKSEVDVTQNREIGNMSIKFEFEVPDIPTLRRFCVVLEQANSGTALVVDLQANLSTFIFKMNDNDNTEDVMDDVDVTEPQEMETGPGEIYLQIDIR